MAMMLDAIISIKRLQQDSNNANKEQYVDNLALQSIACQIQPASPEETAVADGVYGQTYLAFTVASGILTGDHVTVSGTSETYRVKGVEDWSQIDLIPHYEITLIKMEEEEVVS